jgi:hypothetical protein
MDEREQVHAVRPIDGVPQCTCCGVYMPRYGDLCMACHDLKAWCDQEKRWQAWIAKGSPAYRCCDCGQMHSDYQPQRCAGCRATADGLAALGAEERAAAKLAKLPLGHPDRDDSISAHVEYAEQQADREARHRGRTVDWLAWRSAPAVERREGETANVWAAVMDALRGRAGCLQS